jgi:hypothetical protein
MNEPIHRASRKHILFSIKIAGAILGGSLLLTLARHLGWMDAGQVTRGLNVVLGLAFVVYGNAIPKMMDTTPPGTVREATVAQAVSRVAGWSVTLAFVVWTVVWAFAPLPIAKIASIAAVVANLAVLVGYSIWKVAITRASSSV